MGRRLPRDRGARVLGTAPGAAGGDGLSKRRVDRRNYAKGSCDSVAALLLVVVMGGCAVRSTPPARPIGADAAALVRRALHDRIAAGDVPDFNLLPDRRSILVLSDVEWRTGTVLTRAALPEIPGVRLSLISERQARAEARRSGQPVRFIYVGGLRIDGTSGELWIGVDYVREPREELKLCCCTGRVRYVRTGGEWRFAERGETLCS